MGSEPEAGFNVNVCRTLKSFHPAVGTVTSALILKVFWVTKSEELDGICSMNAAGAKKVSRIICSLFFGGFRGFFSIGLVVWGLFSLFLEIHLLLKNGDQEGIFAQK